MFSKIVAMGALALGVLVTQPALADYPEKPVTFIVPNAAGGGVDVALRMLVKHLEKHTDATMIVKNVKGGGTTTGTREVYDAPADGHTLLFFHQAFMGTAAQGILKRDFNDMIPVARTGSIGLMYATGTGVPYEGFDQFVDYAKANPGAVKIGVQLGALNHLIALGLIDNLGIEATPVNVPGGNGPIRAAMLGGQIDMAITAPSVTKGYVDSGDMRPLVMLDNYRSTYLPDMPHSVELGYPDMTFSATMYLFAHKDTPEQARTYWADKMEAVMNDPELQEELGAFIEDIRFSRGEELAAEVAAEYEKFSAIVENHGLKRD
ncbi:Bug family tripartite tricarboxylate transporter substrate binding protein [Oricola sp.]|uniref:Bug family tripartite tricarboxylate transporter substrate binding protein n=1 Tax=Oricola sp. TaxID=1979950 RepID=UPI003BA9D17D